MENTVLFASEAILTRVRGEIFDGARRMRQCYATSSIAKIATGLLLLHVFILFARPQESLAPLRAIKFPLLLALAISALWLPKAFPLPTTQSKILVAFCAYLGVFVFVGKVIIDDLIINDFKSISTWADLTLNFTGLVLPMITFMSQGSGIRKLGAAWVVLLAYLSAYSVTHGGRGPGGFISDENDVCLVLVMLIGLPLVLIPQRIGNIRRLFILGTVALALLGVVKSFSVGGFLGLLSVFLYLFIGTPRKLPLIFTALFIGTAGVLLAPAAYVDELRQLSKPDEGTAGTRRHYWTVAMRVFLDPRNTIQGVGPENTPFNMSGYETLGDLNKIGRSVAGRAMHSMYFQLLPDLGIIGICFVGSLVFISVRNNQRALKELKRVERVMISLGPKYQRYRRIAEQPKSKVDAFRVELADLSDHEVLELGAQSIFAAQRDVQLLRCFFVGVNAAFVGVCGCGAFISVLYYPPLWFVIASSAAAQLLWRRHRSYLMPLVASTAELQDALARQLYVEDRGAT